MTIRCDSTGLMLRGDVAAGRQQGPAIPHMGLLGERGRLGQLRLMTSAPVPFLRVGVPGRYFANFNFARQLNASATHSNLQQELSRRNSSVVRETRELLADQSNAAS